MRAFAWLRSRPRAVASAAVLSAAAVAITTMAFVYDGFPTTEVDLHDGGVWVTKQSSLLIGHFNHESQVLDGGLRTASDEYDILQSGDDVVMVDSADSSVTAIDPAMVVAHRVGGCAGGREGRARRTDVSRSSMPRRARCGSCPAAGLAGVRRRSHRADRRARRRRRRDGRRRRHGLRRLARDVRSRHDPVDAEGEPSDPSRDGLWRASRRATRSSITAVGDVAVVLDAASGTVLSTRRSAHRGRRRRDEAVLQQPSAETDAVIARDRGRARARALRRLEAGRGLRRRRRARPAAPVFLKGCAYARLVGLGDVRARLRRRRRRPRDRQSSGADADAELRFRVNRDVIVLNDIIGGAAWMASDELQQVDNWNDITPPEGETEENDEETTEETVETTLPERTEVNTPPIADGRRLRRPAGPHDRPPRARQRHRRGRRRADGHACRRRAVARRGRSRSTRARGLQIAVPEDASGSTIVHVPGRRRPRRHGHRARAR